MAIASPIGRDFEKLAGHRFYVKVEPNLTIGEFRECTGLSAERDVLEYTEAGNNDFVYKLPGRLKWPNLVLKRGTTDQADLLKWFWDARQMPPKLRAVTVTLVDASATDARSWSFHDAYPVKWAGPELNAGTDNAANETLEIAHGGMVNV